MGVIIFAIILLVVVIVAADAAAFTSSRKDGFTKYNFWNTHITGLVGVGISTIFAVNTASWSFIVFTVLIAFFPICFWLGIWRHKSGTSQVNLEK